MKMEITNQRENKLQSRTEVCFIVDHARESTPGRNAVAEDLAKQFNTKRELVIVDELESFLKCREITSICKSIYINNSNFIIIFLKHVMNIV